MLNGISILKRNPVLFFISALIFFSSNVEASYDFNADCRKAYAEIFNLNFKAAQEIIAREKVKNPGNTVTVLLENNIDFLSAFVSEEDIFFYILIDEKKKKQKKKKKTKKQNY